MRVVAGCYKGRNLKTLKGDTTRPTTMRVKESIFSSLTSLLGTFEDAFVLDAFAGSGALGIEALSRGARQVIFFERSRPAAQVVRDNLKTLSPEEGSVRLELGDAFRLAARKRPRPFDVVFLDPPYAIAPSDVFGLLDSLLRAQSLDAETLICYELAKKNEVACTSEALRLKWETVSMKDFGETIYVLLRKGD